VGRATARSTPPRPQGGARTAELFIVVSGLHPRGACPAARCNSVAPQRGSRCTRRSRRAYLAAKLPPRQREAGGQRLLRFTGAAPSRPPLGCLCDRQASRAQAIGALGQLGRPACARHRTAARSAPCLGFTAQSTCPVLIAAESSTNAYATRYARASILMFISGSTATKVVTSGGSCSASLRKLSVRRCGEERSESP
jgi:hypothetical protein